mmetsp:Transcript_8972/g.10131  ORF Transcript_8972/g.10131 Transcript_8972/m.10131 type:complete len:217 (+) Transcript_8972:267-917(+)
MRCRKSELEDMLFSVRTEVAQVPIMLYCNKPQDLISLLRFVISQDLRSDEELVIIGEHETVLALDFTKPRVCPVVLQPNPNVFMEILVRVIHSNCEVRLAFPDFMLEFSVGTSDCIIMTQLVDVDFLVALDRRRRKAHLRLPLGVLHLHFDFSADLVASELLLCVARVQRDFVLGGHDLAAVLGSFVLGRVSKRVIDREFLGEEVIMISHEVSEEV